MKNIIIIVASLVMATGLRAQQDPMLSQYMFNGLFLNPAYAGSHKYLTTSLLYRTQWVQLEGAPTTTLLSVDGPIADENMGLGLVVSSDQIGVTRQTDVYANYAYHVRIDDSRKLALGVKGGLSHYSAQLTDLKVWDEQDQVFNSDISSGYLPKFGVGAFYYSEKMYAGLSIPTLLAYDPGDKFNLDVNKSTFVRRHYLLTAGILHKINDKILFKPSFLLKYTNNAPLEADFNLALMFNEVIWVGASYRTGDAVIGIVEYQANKRFRVGYSYDLTTNRLRKFSSGSHEIMIGYDFGKDLMKVKTPRFF